MAGRVLLAATVTEVGNGPFVYPACHQCYCKLTSLENNIISKCYKCCRVYKSEDVYYRFRLCATITDSLSDANITAFGGMFDYFFGETASKFHEKMLYLQEKYHSWGLDLMKLAVEQTFVGQNLLFGFKVNPAVLKKCNSKVPRQQVLLSEVVNDSIKLGYQTVSSTQTRSKRDLVAVQVAHQDKPHQHFKTVSDWCCELDRLIEDKCKVLPVHLDRANLRIFLNSFFTKNRNSQAFQPSQSISPYICGRSQTAIPYSDNNLSSESEVSSIRLSCDSFIQKMKGSARTEPMANITNVCEEMTKPKSLVKTSEYSRNKSVVKNHKNEENVQFLRRSKRIMANRKKRNISFANERTASNENSFCVSDCRKKSSYEKVLHNASRYTSNNSVMTEEELSLASSSSKTCDPGNKENQASEVSALLFHSHTIIDDVAPATSLSSDNQAILKCAVTESSKNDNGTPFNYNLKYFEIRNSDNLLNDVALQQKTFSHEEERLIWRMPPFTTHSNTLCLESEMELTSNLPSQLEPSMIDNCDNPGSQCGHKTSKSRQSLITVHTDHAGALPESENLYDFLEAGQFSYETHISQIDNKKNMRAERSKINGVMTSEDNVNNAQKVLMLQKNCDSSMLLNYLDNVSFSNVTSRSKRKSKKHILDNNNSNNLFDISLFPGSVEMTSTTADVTNAPESEDIYDFLEGIGLRSQSGISFNHKRNINLTLPSPEKARVYPSSSDKAQVSKLKNSFEASVESLTNSPLEEFKCANTQTDEPLSYSVSPINNDMESSNNLLKRFADQQGDQRNENIDISTCLRISSTCEPVGKEYVRSGNFLSPYGRKIHAQLPEKNSFQSNDPVGLVDTSPELNASCDLFDSSLFTSGSMGRHCSPKHNSWNTQNIHCETESFNNLNYDSSTSTDLCGFSLSTPLTGNQKVRFKKKRKEILFHDFEIISHLPVPYPLKKNVKSCLKKELSPPKMDVTNCNSQDLFESPQHTKTPEKKMDIISLCSSSSSKHYGSSPWTNSTAYFGPITQDISGSQELFSSEDLDSPQLSNSWNTKLKEHNEIKCSHFKVPLHQATSINVHFNEQAECSQVGSLTNQDTNRNSLDLFSQSFC